MQVSGRSRPSAEGGGGGAFEDLTIIPNINSAAQRKCTIPKKIRRGEGRVPGSATASGTSLVSVRAHPGFHSMK